MPIIAEWLLDEASSGTAPTTATDNVGSNDLTVFYDTANANWTSVAQGNGFQITQTESSGNAGLIKNTIDAAGEIGDDLGTTGQVSIVMVIDIDNASTSDNRMFYIGTDGDNGVLAVASSDTNTPDSVNIRWNTEALNRYYYSDNGLVGYRAIGVVIDTSQATDTDRVKLYTYNGTFTTEATTLFFSSTHPAQNETVAFDSASYGLALGNRTGTTDGEGDFSNMNGSIYYCGVWDEALSVGAIETLMTDAYDNNDTTPVGGGTSIPVIQSNYMRRRQGI